MKRIIHDSEFGEIEVPEPPSKHEYDKVIHQARKNRYKLHGGMTKYYWKFYILPKFSILQKCWICSARKSCTYCLCHMKPECESCITSKVVSKTLEVFEHDEEAARRWLITPNIATNNLTPLQMAKLDEKEVLDLIGRIENGVYS